MNQSVAKAISLLDLFVEEKELSLQEIANKAKIPKPTAYRLLSTLQTGGLLYKEKSGPHDSRYRLGLKLLELGNLVSERLEIREIALPFMEALAKELNEVVHLVIVNHNEATYIERVNSRRALSLHTQIGRSTPLYVGSGPKLLLAFLSDEIQNNILNNANLYTLSDHKPINKDELRKELLQIRKNHVSLSISEQDADTTGVSFPIFDFQNNVVAALAISGLSNRFQGEALDHIKTKGMRTALNISEQLGFKNKNSKVWNK